MKRRRKALKRIGQLLDQIATSREFGREERNRLRTARRELVHGFEVDDDKAIEKAIDCALRMIVKLDLIAGLQPKIDEKTEKDKAKSVL